MNVTSVTDAKARLSALLRRVSQGETVLIQKHGKPVARLVPAAAGGDAPSDEELTRLEQEGIVRLPSLLPDPELLVPGDAFSVEPEQGLLAALLDEREAEP